MTLVEFLLARIAEDEAHAKDTMPFAERHGIGSYPARVLAECEAKRRLVDEYARVRREVGQGHTSERTMVAQNVRWKTLCILATVYADHSDHDPRWKSAGMVG
jgi:hypothetical protein